VVAERYLTGTGVFVRWFLKQQGWEDAHRFRDRYLGGEIELQTTECARVELPHVLRTRGLLTKKLTVDDCRAAVRIIDDFEIPVDPLTAHVLEASAMLAVEHNLRFFDAVFLQRAATADLILLTPDRPLGRVAELAGVQLELIGTT